MMLINNLRKKGLAGAFLSVFLLSGISTTGQIYRFKNYGPENNLPSNVIYTLNQDNNGYLWIGTTKGLSRFDGFDFTEVSYPDSAFGRYPVSSLKDINGRLWFGFNDGTIFWSDGKSLQQVYLSNSSAVSCLLEGPDGNIYAVPQRKSVYRIDPLRPDKIDTLSLSGDPVMFSASFTSDGRLLIGTQENLLLCRLKNSSLDVENTYEEFDYASVTAIQPMAGGEWFTICTDGNGIYQLRLSGSKSELKRFHAHPELNMLSVKSLTKDSANSLWLATTETGAVKLSFAEGDSVLQSVRFIGKSSGLPGDNVSVIFQDVEDNVWLGFNGNGLSMLSSDAFSFYAPGDQDDPKSIIYIGNYKSNYLLGTPLGYYIYDPVVPDILSFRSFSSISTGAGDISSYYVDETGNVWIGTKGKGLYIQNKDGKTNLFYRSGDTGADYITHIAKDGGNIWLATLNGVRMIDERSASLRNSFNINNGLPHNSINQLLLNDDGSVYLATESDRLFRVDSDSEIFSSEQVLYGMLLNKILALTRGKEGAIWAATQGNGIFECRDDSVKSFTTADGLFSNYAYSIFSDSEGEIWIGHERGISRYNPGTGVIKVYETDFARGGSCNPNGFFESPDGKVFIGTTEGIIIYDKTKDIKQQLPPYNNINSIVINDLVYPYKPVISLPYKKRYSVRINYVGISLSNPQKVYYSTYLENYDNEWSNLSSSREVSYSLRDGKYRFNLISVNEEGLSEEMPVTFEIIIKPPVWRAWWFIMLVLAALVAGAILIVREREKAQKKIQEYLEKELEARTEVVRKQKGEIEQQNMEITDSINYARRIQSSILPDLGRLKEHFSDAFVLLYPRDIVSGDFYWFDKPDSDRFVLVCADSTGHGVPGAFMSMIGTTLLQDIVSRQGITRPSEILSKLDKQIFSTLNQNLEAGISNDGMDMVVCEFTLKNRHIRFASAMRPVILVIGGESYYIKGNRSSVGGESVTEKYFDDQEYYLNEGDTLYMFSDGMPDQFGGPEGKKMKISRLKALIEEILPLPLDQQAEAISSFYSDWKGSYDQVDDILLMGIRV